MSKWREMFHVACITALAVAVFAVQNSKPSPTKTVVVHDNTPTTGCSLPIKVGNYGFIKKGRWGNFQAKVVGKVDNGTDCAYSVHIQPKKQDNRYYATDVYTNVNSDNLFPVDGETIR